MNPQNPIDSLYEKTIHVGSPEMGETNAYMLDALAEIQAGDHA